MEKKMQMFAFKINTPVMIEAASVQMFVRRIDAVIEAVRLFEDEFAYANMETGFCYAHDGRVLGFVKTYNVEEV
jgi:hypothetical protein